jgi:hypothetical protein
MSALVLFLALARAANTSVIELTDEHITVITSRTDPVTISGRGRLVGSLNAPFNLTDVTIVSGSEVAADGLTVLRKLHILGTAYLMGISGDWVSLGTGVDLILTANGNEIPRVNLGGVGRAYATRPSRITMQINVEEISESDVKAIRVPIVTGQTLSNCEYWQGIARVAPPSRRFRFECDPPENETVDETGLRSLYLIGLPSWADPPDNNWVLIVAVVVSAIAIGAVIIAVCMYNRRPHNDGMIVSTLDTRGYTEPMGAVSG